MDELVRYGPWLLSLVALLLAWGASTATSRARARVSALERTIASRPPPDAADGRPPTPPIVARPLPFPSSAFEERLGALELRIAKLAELVADAARPDPDEVAPMRPPAPGPAEPSSSPSRAWRMFP